jgi:hypothetical protein
VPSELSAPASSQALQSGSAAAQNASWPSQKRLFLERAVSSSGFESIEIMFLLLQVLRASEAVRPRARRVVW